MKVIATIQLIAFLIGVILIWLTIQCSTAGAHISDYAGLTPTQDMYVERLFQDCVYNKTGISL